MIYACAFMHVCLYVVLCCVVLCCVVLCCVVLCCVVLCCVVLCCVVLCPRVCICTLCGQFGFLKLLFLWASLRIWNKFYPTINGS